MLRRRLEDVRERRDERVDPAAEVLEIDQQDVEGLHHGVGRPPHLAIQAEHGNSVHRIGEVARFDHVVLLVAAQAVLGPERRRER